MKLTLVAVGSGQTSMAGNKLLAGRQARCRQPWQGATQPHATPQLTKLCGQAGALLSFAPLRLRLCAAPLPLQLLQALLLHLGGVPAVGIAPAGAQEQLQASEWERSVVSRGRIAAAATSNSELVLAA